MKFLTAQPDTDYYIWQLKVQMNNFRKLGIEKDAIILLGYNKKNGKNPNAVDFKKQTTAIVIFIEDTRKNPKYIPSLRPHIIKKFYKSKFELVENQDVFYHDSDIIFRELPDFKLIGQTKKIVMSDTVSYVGAKYIQSKSNDLLEKMCAIVGIDLRIVIARDAKSGGAQTYIPSIYKLDFNFWDRVEKHSEELYGYMESTKNQYNPQHPIQSWTSDMWALLWNFWNVGMVTEISSELSFTWPGNTREEWNRNKIFHNAGVTPSDTKFFNKTNFIDKSPFDADLTYVSIDHASYEYVKEILEAKNTFK